MRRLLPALAAALLSLAGVAFADDPPSTPLTLSTPAAGSDLPDMGSPAAAVLASSTESELAGVMAHETAHVTQHHIARMIRNQQQQSIASAAALLAAILLGAIGGGQAMEGGIAAAQGVAAQQQINFTRDNEW